MDILKLMDVGGKVVDKLDDSGLFEMVLGCYSDGTVRSIPDAIRGEIYSPKQKAKALKKKKRRRKEGIRLIDFL